MSYITRDQHDLIVETVEEAVLYSVQALCSNGELISGEQSWAVVAALATSKLIEYGNGFDEYDSY